MPKKKSNLKPETQRVPVGTFCKILRPNLWAGFDCLVTEYRESCHIVRITRMDGSSFPVPTKFEELKPHA